MFYNKLIKLCKIYNEKPTPLLKSLGLSATNLKRWQNGSTVNSNILAKLSEHFDVPVDYFFDEDENENEQIFISLSKQRSSPSLKDLYDILKTHPDYIASLRKGTEDELPRFNDYQRIADYMRIDFRYLITPEHYCKLIRLPDKEKTSKLSNISPKDMIFSILSKLPASEEYKFLQVRISMTILQHLMIIGITPQQLEETLLLKQKIYELGDIGIPEKNKKNYNFSDLCRISEEIEISFDCMLTGICEK